MNNIRSNPDYSDWLKEIKGRIANVRIKTARAANMELIQLYWYLGSQITEKQKYSDWGSSFIDRFSKDLKKEFPGIAGFSAKNLRYCRAFYCFYADIEKWQRSVAKLEKASDDIKWQQFVAKIRTQSFSAPDVEGIVPQIAGQVPWSHNIHIFTKSESLEEAIFYVQQSIENGWSRDVLALQIRSGLFRRQGKGISNFHKTLPSPQSDLAEQTLKDPYVFDFMTMTKPYNESDIEKKLVGHITRFLLELGKGFAFIGRQYHIEVGDNDYYLDLLFYHVKLKCYVVIELKNTRFIPEYAGKLNFYLSAVDTLIKEVDDNPTIGILLCRDKNSIEVEFALRDLNKPMGVSEFTFTEVLPEELKGSLPTVEEIESDFEQLHNNTGEK